MLSPVVAPTIPSACRLGAQSPQFRTSATPHFRESCVGAELTNQIGGTVGVVVVVVAAARCRGRPTTRRGVAGVLLAAAEETQIPLAPPEPDAVGEYIHTVINTVDSIIAAELRADDTAFLSEFPSSALPDKAPPWKEVAGASASCRVQVTRPITRVRMVVDTAKQVDEGFELIKAPEGDQVTGAVPLFLEIGGWPTWYPFCTEARLLRDWTAEELVRKDSVDVTANPVWGASSGVSRANLWQLVFKLGPILRVDTVGLAVERPGHIEKEGQLWHYVFAPEPESTSGPNANTCLGVKIPELDKKGALINIRVPLLWSRTAFEPVAADRGLVTFCGDVVNLINPGPFRWAIRLFWGTIATRAIGVMRKHLETPIRPLTPERVRFYEQLTETMGAHVDATGSM